MTTAFSNYRSEVLSLRGYFIPVRVGGGMDKVDGFRRHRRRRRRPPVFLTGVLKKSGFLSQILLKCGLPGTNSAKKCFFLPRILLKCGIPGTVSAKMWSS